jgi:wyosine [tRNA(Phe)-imidazoG37] synthetase (radical SAM superfamily)
MSDTAIPIRSTWPAVRDHSRRHADFAFVYPVISRRSGGLSIGVNLNPDKVCNFDCVYCEVDRRTPGRASKVDLDQVRDELTALIQYVKTGGLEQESKFAGLPAGVARTIKDIAFSGDGEPTMVHNFEDCVRVVAEVRRGEQLGSTKLVLITDAAGLDKSDVRRGLALMDAHGGEVWGKLDAGSEEYFRLVNRTQVRFDRILKNLTLTARERPIVIQSLFLRVHGAPMPPAEIEAYCDRLIGMVRAGARIREVHAYTIARPTPEPWATRLTLAELEELASVIRLRTDLTVRVFD